MDTVCFTHPACRAHDPGPGHPERPARLDAVLEAVAALGLPCRSAPRAPREALERVHEAAYLDALEAAVPATGRVWLDADTALSPASWEAAVRAAGAVLAAVDGCLDGQHRRAFCAVRPPGHHAERARAMGFCLLNNIAVGAARALDRGLKRVAILDFDVHHGNGTEAIFRDHPGILYCSSFQHPAYPHPDPRACAANVVCVPLPPGTDGAAYRAAVGPAWAAALEGFRPQLVLVSAGFDAHRDDPLAELRLEETDYAWLGERIAGWARAYAQGRVVAALEGGYDLTALNKSVSAHLRALTRS